ncbi:MULTISPECIES: DUF1540 domain-containing protein [Clostridium]|uniref:DUF1540 domain-containing protein n=1 Tax=Clostridium paridis TaxID=2803863 RepID=A0A937FBM3_9CLOT|nr:MULTISPECIES: DUF1540 domain-containing protein [Clostridium]MBL4930323.1 DUF1540 domain-containing protein [Clostridium paridis]
MNQNRSIGCIVTECKFHSEEEQFCSLDKIQIVKHNNKANNIQQTDCGSFKVK